MIAAFGVSGAPLLNGFISKSILMSSLEKEGWRLAEAALGLASVGTFLSIGLKLSYHSFFGPPRPEEFRPLPSNLKAGMALGAGLCVLFGIFPSWLYAFLPYGSAYEAYSMKHISDSLQTLAGTGLAFWFLRSKLKLMPAITLDFDWFYRGKSSAAALIYQRAARADFKLRGAARAAAGIFLTFIRARGKRQTISFTLAGLLLFLFFLFMG